MDMLELPFPFSPGQRGLLALMDEDDKPRGLLGLFDRDEAPADDGSSLANQAWSLAQQAAEPYVNFYQNSIVRPFYTGLDALAQTPFGDPGFYASIQGLGPPGALVGGAGALAANGLRALAGFGRAAETPVLLDSSVVPKLRKAPELGGRILDGETPIVSYVTQPELANAVLTGRGLNGVPRFLDDLPVLEQRPSLDTRINVRGQLRPEGSKKPVHGVFGDGIIGAQAIENEIPLVTDDELFKIAVRKYGGEVR